MRVQILYGGLLRRAYLTCRLVMTIAREISQTTVNNTGLL